MKTKLKTALWRWTIRKLRVLVDVADDWLHAREVTLRDSLATLPVSAQVSHDMSVDRRASAAREKTIRKTRVARPRLARLRYEGGQFVYLDPRKVRVS